MARWANLGAAQVSFTATFAGPVYGGDNQARDVKIAVRNVGDSTLLDVVAKFTWPQRLPGVEMVAGGQTLAVTPAINPHSEASETVTLGVFDLIYEQKLSPDETIDEVELLFTDDANNRWRVTKDGALVLTRRRPLDLDEPRRIDP